MSASQEDVINALVGNAVVDYTEDTLVLSNGVRLRFDKSNSECCSYVELAGFQTCPGVITSATFGDNEEETGYEGDYKAWINVLTEATDLNIVDVDGNASNGYYLHGFSLNVEIIDARPEPATDDEIAEALDRLTGG